MDSEDDPETSNYFSCPRCGAKASINDSRCYSCGLIFYPEEDQEQTPDEGILEERPRLPTTSGRHTIRDLLKALKTMLRMKNR